MEFYATSFNLIGLTNIRLGGGSDTWVDSERRWVVILLQTLTLEIQLILSHLLCNVEALRTCMPRHMEIAKQ